MKMRELDLSQELLGELIEHRELVFFLRHSGTYIFLVLPCKGKIL